MGNDIINDEVKMNLTYTNFCLILFKEIWDFFYSFFKKRIKQFSLAPGAKDYFRENIKYSDLKTKNANIYFDLYIEDILEFDPNFIKVYKILKKSKSFVAERQNFIKMIKSSPYYLLSILKLISGIIILNIFFYYTIKGDDYVCSYNLAFNYTKTNNSFDNDIFNNYWYWPCKLGKCKVEKAKFNKIKILRVLYFIIFDLPFIVHGIYFLKTFEKITIQKWIIILYQLADYILLFIIFIVNLIDTESCFYSEDNPNIFHKQNKSFNILIILLDYWIKNLKNLI